MNLRLFTVTALIGAALAGSASAATIVVNGSFEQGAGSGASNGTGFGNLGRAGSSSWDIYTGTQVTGWNAGPYGIEIQTDATLPASGGANVDAQDGENYVELDTTRNSTIRQTVFLSGGTYTLSFFYAPRVNTTAASQTTNAITYGLRGAGGSLFTLMVDGPSGSVPFGKWTKINYVFAATQGNYDLVFSAAGQSDGYGGLVDNVSISAVPVPAAGLLLLGAIGGLGLVRRRRKVSGGDVAEMSEAHPL
jgi:hypothetical protein